MESNWKSYPCRYFTFEDHEATIVFPEKPNGHLAVKTEYRDAFPAAIEFPLLEHGFHLCFLKNDNRWAADEDLERKARFVRFVQKEYGLKDTCVPVGMSCGGLIAIKFAAKYPELIQCLYLDAPVLNYMSCPCGFGIGQTLENYPHEILNSLKLSSVSELICYRDMPMDKLPILVQNRIPVVLVAGDSDQTVPYCENGILLEKAYRAAGIDLEVYIKPGCDHHPHGLEDPTPALQFILRHCGI